MKAHDGTIVTSAPDVMWGTDGVRVLTADDGWVWTFAAIDHWNAECVGWHVCKVGTVSRPSSRSRQDSGGSTARSRRTWPVGLALRMDHGSQYLSDHFLDQLRYWGHPAQLRLFVEEPETNGVAERCESHAQGASRLRPRLSKSRRPYARPSMSSSNATQCWRLEKLVVSHALEAREEYELRHAA